MKTYLINFDVLNNAAIKNCNKLIKENSSNKAIEKLLNTYTSNFNKITVNNITELNNFILATI